MRQIISLNRNWEFGRLPEGTVDSLPEDFVPESRVDLPHTWYTDENPYNGVALYRTEFEFSLEEGQSAFLEFCGVDRWCRIFINGCLAGEHKGGYSTFRVPVPEEKLREGKIHLDVLVDNRPWDFISPLGGDFTFFGGIYRDINLVITQKTHFDMMYYGSQGIIIRAEYDKEEEEGILYIEPHVTGADDRTVVRYELLSVDGDIVMKQEAAAAEALTCRIPNPILWNGKKNPYLYRLRASLIYQDEMVDQLELMTGFRSIRMDPEKGFFLNGEHLRICGVAKHQDYGNVYSAAGPDQWEQDMDLIREVGANAVRLSHYQHPQYFYNLCDREGMIVWAEIPMLSMPDSAACMENARQQLKELIFQNIHHPAICFWGIQNEIGIMGDEPYMIENCKELNRLAKEIDPGRFTTGANMYTVKADSGLNSVTDMIGYNIYFGWYYGEMPEYSEFLDRFHEARPALPLGISEYGVDCNLNFHQEKPKVKDYSEEYQSLFHETVYPIFRSKDYLWGSFIWNMFDFSSARRNEGGSRYLNCKGLVTYDRKTRKDSFYYYKAQWSEDPFVHIAEKRFQKRCAETMNVKVYSNQETVTLSAGEQIWSVSSENGVFVFENVPLEKGENKIFVNAGCQRDEAVFIRVEEPESSYIFVDPNPEINVRNWYLDDQDKQKLFPDGKCAVTDPVEDLVKNNSAMEVIEEWSPALAQMMRERANSMALLRYINFQRKQFKEEDVKELNRRLNEIPR